MPYIYRGVEQDATYINSRYIFEARGNSVYEIADLYQQGKIKPADVSANIFARTLYVVLPTTDYKFTPGDEYHLHLASRSFPFSPAVYAKHVFRDEYVPQDYRYKLSSAIQEATWHALFGNTRVIPSIADEKVEYSVKLYFKQLKKTSDAKQDELETEQDDIAEILDADISTDEEAEQTITPDELPDE